jgi:hypothetical protein
MCSHIEVDRQADGLQGEGATSEREGRSVLRWIENSLLGCTPNSPISPIYPIIPIYPINSFYSASGISRS